MGDDFGIITDSAARRAMWGDRRCHGKVAALPLRPVVVVPGPRPEPIRRPPPVVVAPPPAPVIHSVSVNDVLRAVTDTWGVPRGELLGKKVRREFSRPRIAAYLLLRRLTNMSQPAIAFAMCRADHSSIHAGLKRAVALYERDAGWRVLYETAAARLQSGGDVS